MTLLQHSKVGRTTVRIRPSARGGLVGCKAQCRRDYGKDRAALVQCYRSCKEFNTGRAFNGGSTGPEGAVAAGPECQPPWPDLPPGASLTIDPSRPPPTTAQQPFCDWPAGSCLADVPSYPPVAATAPPQPRLSNARVRRRGRVAPRATTRVAPGPSARACDGETCAKCGGTCTWVEDNGKTKMICYDWWTGTSKQSCHNRMRPGLRPRAVRARNQGPRFSVTAREISQLMGRGR